uniref:Uncharacterized protein n=1 Tax=Oryza nivara TaxID=4536 RepID=A0A0E0J9D3_ORYNI
MAAGVGTAMTARAYHGVAGWRSSMARGAVWPKQGQPAVGFGSMHWRGLITYSVGSQERGEANCGIWRHITQ